MRTDKNLSKDFSSSERWNYLHGTGGEMKNMFESPAGSEHQWTTLSHSGNERNRTFINDGKGGFHNASGVSGADLIADARSAVIWDFDRDGRQDLAVVNANTPLLKILANRVEPEGRQFIAFRFLGGNHTSAANGTLSCRDAIGAMVVIETNSGTVLRALSAGEGFASQNSKTLVVGIGKAESARSVQVIWRSGKTQKVENVAAKSLLILSESTDIKRVKYFPETPSN